MSYRDNMANELVTISENKTPIFKKVFEPAGVNHELQKAVTDLMDTIVSNAGQYTLAELGYLHMNMTSYVEDHVELKVYFAAELATKSVPNKVNGSQTIIPHPALNVFNGYLFVGDLKNAVSYANVDVPRYVIDRDSRDQLAVRIKDGKKITENAEVVVLQCNLALTMASIMDVSVLDPDFSVAVETVSKNTKKKSDMGIMLTAGSTQEFPVRVTVTGGMNAKAYSPDDAIPYLLGCIQTAEKAKQVKKKLANKVSNKANEINKKAEKKNNKWMKYR